MKKLLLTIAGIVLLVIIGAIIAFYRPWQSILTHPLVDPGTALTVNLTRGKAEVYLDDKKVGETPYSSEDLRAGDHTLELRRMSEDPDFYVIITKQIHLEPNTRTFVEAEIGPSEQFSSYKLFYYRKENSQNAAVYIKTNPSQANVSIDDSGYGTSPVTTDELSPGKHDVEISKDGYKTENGTFIVREGYTLIAEFDLMAKPIDLGTE